MSDQTPAEKPDLRNAKNPRVLTEAEAGWFTELADGLAKGEAVYVPHTGKRMALVNSDGVLGLVDLHDDAPTAEAVTKSTRQRQTSKLDPETADLFRSHADQLRPGQSTVLDGGAVLRKDTSGTLWLEA